MTLSGGRRIEHASREYEWVVRRRGNVFRLVAQDLATRGQILVTHFPVYVLHLPNESHGDYYKRTRISAERIREELSKGWRSGWRPTSKRRPPMKIESGGGWGLEDAWHLQLIDDLWTILDAVCCDAAWQALLECNTGEFVPVSAEYVRGLDSRLESRLADLGGLVVYVRDSDHGDGIPHLTIRSLQIRRDLVLEEVSEWHQGWRT